MKKRILLVDDEPDFGLLLQRVMRTYELRHEVDPTRTLRVAMSFQPDLFILDLKMPQMSGAELAQAIRQDVCFKDIPIILLSASIMIPDFAEEPTCLDGCPAFPKPFNVETLRSQVAKEIRRAEHSKSGLKLLPPAELGTMRSNAHWLS